MFLTVHTTTAVTLAQHIQNPILAFFVGMASHYLLDAIPHGDDEFFDRWKGKKQIKIIAIAAIIDIAILLVWLSYVFKKVEINYPEAAVYAVIGSVVPDFLYGIYRVTKIRFLKWAFELNEWVHTIVLKKPIAAAKGFFIQGIFFLIILLILF